MQIELCQLEQGNLATLRDWRNQPNIRERCREYRLLNMLNQERWWEQMTLDPHIEMFGIRVPNVLVGVCGLTSIHWVNRTAEVSIYVGHEDFQRKGIGLAALKALESKAFGQFNLHRLWAETYSFNGPAIGLFEKAGYVLEGTMKAHVFWRGRYWDSLLYGLVDTGTWGATVVQEEDL